MKYADLRSGGVALAAALERHHRVENTIVLGIVRGGVTLALEVASTLELPVDLVLLRPMMQRLPGAPVAAARVAGNLVLDDELSTITSHSPQTVEETFIAEAIEALGHREETCRGPRPAAEINGKTVLLVDNGLRTGGTMRLAINAVRRLAPVRIVAAVPTGSREAVALISPLADEVICLSSPVPYPHVGAFYKNFDVGSEQEIRTTLDSWNARTAG
ncbi:MAG: phosphoribosyltransferase family protein [Thermoanaerobaculia bacterium]